MSNIIDISGLDKAEVLAALFNASRPLGMGILHYNPEDMTKERAEEILALDREPYFDYLQGRVMKIDLSDDDMFVGLYDRDNGQGAASAVISKLRSAQETGNAV